MTNLTNISCSFCGIHPRLVCLRASNERSHEDQWTLLFRNLIFHPLFVLPPAETVMVLAAKLTAQPSMPSMAFTPFSIFLHSCRNQVRLIQIHLWSLSFSTHPTFRNRIPITSIQLNEFIYMNIYSYMCFLYYMQALNKVSIKRQNRPQPILSFYPL